MASKKIVAAADDQIASITATMIRKGLAELDNIRNMPRITIGA
jgi:hypothetical protein